jgi:serine phosphatase RsbU (regulator of sigma subunit)/ketosteroid isomerase-like protein
MSAGQIRAVFARRLEAITRLDARAAAADYADDCVLESPFAGKVTGRDAIEQTFRTWFAMFPDATFQNEQEPLIFSDRAVQFVTIRGTDSGRGLGRAPTGRPFSAFTTFLCTFREGQIVYERRIYDFAGVLFQLEGEPGIASENSKLYRAIRDGALLSREVATAAKIQQALMPPAQYVGVNFEIAAASVPCRAIGGDFVDYFDLPAGAFGFALGDIAGKGPPAALLAGVVQGILAGRAPDGGTPAETLTHVNHVLLRRAIDARFATVAYGVLSSDGRLTYCTAGHNPPLLIAQQGRRRFTKGGLMLGAFEHATFEQETVQLHPGDLVVAFSDGMTEAADGDGEEFGEVRVLECIEAHRELPPAAHLDRLFERVREFTNDAPQQDDLTALVLLYTGTAV